MRLERRNTYELKANELVIENQLKMFQNRNQKNYRHGSKNGYS